MRLNVKNHFQSVTGRANPVENPCDYQKYLAKHWFASHYWLILL